jgi:hypothetical protein
MGRLRHPGLFWRLVQSVNARIGKKHGACRAALEACPDCSSAVQRERQYLERLHRAAVPDAPDDLVARLLSRTQELAMAVPEPVSRPRSRMKLVQLVLACTAAVAGLMGVAAFVVGADPAPQAGTAAAGSLTDRGGTLAAQRVQELRNQGWICPDLARAGFHLVSAKTDLVAGEPVVELRLSDGESYATIIEQHSSSAGASQGLSAAVREPVNPLTGHAASEDGFSQATSRDGLNRGSLWVSTGTTQRAIYRVNGITFTYVSDLQKQDTESALSALIQSAPDASLKGQAAVRGSSEEGAEGEDLVGRLQRGIGRIFGGITAS